MENHEESIIEFVNGRFVHRGDTYKETATEHVLKTHVFSGQTAKVVRGYGLTLNLKNYESARFDVRVEVPCYIEDVDVADEWAKKWVEKRVREEVSGVRGSAESAKPADKKPSF